MDFCLSILVPVYNEEEFVGTLLERVLQARLPDGMSREVIVVDDCSTDGSAQIVEQIAQMHPPGLVRLIRKQRNEGKGAAIRTAIEHATGAFSVIQDADLEYNPDEFVKLLKPILEGRADAVYGSRFVVAGERRVLYFWHSLANHFLTTLCNIASDLNLTDMETCYKVFRTSLLKSIPIRSKRFGFEPEVTIKLSKREARIYEVPIDYHGRTYAEGKKIGLKDAFEAVLVILRNWATSDIYIDPDQRILHAFSYAPKFNRWMADTIRPYLGARTLELGAGMGNLTRELAAGHQRYVATDINREHMERLRARLEHRRNVEVHPCDLASAEHFEPFENQVDSVVCLNVLEHIQDDRCGLRNIHSALKPGGRAIILVPEGMSLYSSLDEVLGHFRRYSEEELRCKLEQAGFAVERILRFNRISRPGWYFNGRILKRRSISPLQLRIFDQFVWLWRRMDARLPWKGTSLIAVAVKLQAVTGEERAPERAVVQADA